MSGYPRGLTPFSNLAGLTFVPWFPGFAIRSGLFLLTFRKVINIDHYFRYATIAHHRPDIGHLSVSESAARSRLEGSSHMPEYRAYIIGSDGHFHSSVPLECDDDTEAMEKAKQLVNGHDIELWQRARKIARFEHQPKIQF
jgi:hypothetical protein